MCASCDNINATIARFQRLLWSVNDQQFHEASGRLIAELEAKKKKLHPKE